LLVFMLVLQKTMRN